MNKIEVSNETIEKDFLLYLKEENILKDLEVAATDYEKNVIQLLTSENFPPPISIQLKLDVQKLKKISVKLYKLFVMEPIAGLAMAKNVILRLALTFISNFKIDKNDLQLMPLIFNLPLSSEISRLLRYPSHRLETIQGMLFSKTTISKYLRSSYYKCETHSCPQNVWQRYYEKPNNVCPNCYSTMKEHMASSETGEEILCQFIPLQFFNSLGRFQTFPVKLRDELCYITNLQIGQEYMFTGRLNQKIFEALNIQPIPLLLEGCSSLPDSISALYFEVKQANPSCLWSFVVALSSCMGSFLIPPTSFLNLKIGLMLSLATLESATPVPLVAVGRDSLNTQILFQAAGKFAKRFINLNAISNLGGSSKPEYKSDIICQEAGQLVLGTNGICNIGDWSTLKKGQSDYICQTIESGQIVFTMNELKKTNIINYVPLKCAIWTYWCSLKKSNKYQLQFKKLVNVFGIPFLGQENDEDEEKKICWKNLSISMKNSENTENCEKINSSDFKEFFQIINTKQITLSEAATQLIQSYFIVSRRDRIHCLPLGAVKTITSLAEAHARLSLRNEVLYEDVVAVIYLYEEAMSYFFGQSQIPYSFASLNTNEPVYTWMSREMRRFSGWLEEYVLYL